MHLDEWIYAMLRWSSFVIYETKKGFASFYIFGEYSNTSVPDSYETVVSNTWNQAASNQSQQEDEVVSGFQFPDNSVQFDLNIPPNDSYGYVYGDGGEQFVQQNNYGVNAGKFDLNNPVDNSYDYVFGDCGDQQQNNYGGDNAGQFDLNIPFEYPYGYNAGQQQNNYAGDNAGQQQNNYAGDNADQKDEDDADEIDPEDSYPIIVSFEADMVFQSRQELVNWVQNRGIEHGYVITTKRSKEKPIWLQCSLGGQYKSVATVRKTGSKKIGCPFELKGSFVSNNSYWKLEVKNPMHNHSPIENLEGHAYARRLSVEEKRLVGELAELDIPARNIWAALTKNNPEKKVIKKDIQNVVQKINKENKVGESPMEQMENYFKGKDYVYYTNVNNTTKAVEDIFFMHKHSYTMWCAFPHVLLIDATYQTNIYGLPFVQVVGMTSTNQSFAVAHAFISNEKTENYAWVLRRLSDMLEKNMQPRVIVTDRELALMSACKQIFPNAHRYLCRFHIQQNILRNCKKHFLDGEWKEFIRFFSLLCESTTEPIYEYNLTNFEAHLKESGRGEVFEYVHDNWLKPYRQKFVSAWTNRTINFHQTTTNRVEGMHALFKKDLPSHRNSLVKLVKFVDRMVNRQYTEIKRAFEISIRKVMNHHRNVPMFAGVLRKMSIYAIDLLSIELKRKDLKLKKYGSTCGCQLFTSCGLPCACRLEGLIMRYAAQIPRLFYPYISKIKDVKPDGHCGFRATAAGLGIGQEDFLFIRNQLLLELRMNGNIWRRVFDPEDRGHYDAIYERIKFFGVGRAPVEHWMQMPEAGFLIAQRWGVIVHIIDMAGSATIFPLLGSPEGVETMLAVSLVFVDSSHYIMLKLEGSYPMPTVNPLWHSHRTEWAAPWYDLYRDRIIEYENLRRPDLNIDPHVYYVG
ncbi:hypothetical protein QVD17_36629 [Tagetes erecta]|uniref:MULE transposase domain-containing protein n=1 Tax=Tagetes erecta TaxID=13708 RepID=A0AAD8JWQ0_TARER|nr:hypothetical protein QVD17_36629 [Tagetes erecta]